MVESADFKECFGTNQRRLQRNPLTGHRLNETIPLYTRIKFDSFLLAFIQKYRATIAPYGLRITFGELIHFLKKVWLNPIIVIQKMQVSAFGDGCTCIA